MAEGRKIRITTLTEITREYEIDVDKLLADDYFEDVDLTSHEALGDRLEEWLDGAPDNWGARWVTELDSLLSASRTVYEVDLNPASEGSGS